MSRLAKKLLTFLILLIVIGLVVYGIHLVLPLLGLPPVANTVILIIIAVIIIIAIAQYFGLLGGD